MPGRFIRPLLFIIVASGLVATACRSASPPAPRLTATPVPWVDRPAALWTPTATTTPTQTFPACAGSQLHAEYAGGTGYAGGYGESFRLTNTSSSGCSLSGFPVVEGIGAHGSRVQLYTPPEGAKLQKVNLRPGEAADVQFTFPDCGIHLAGRTPVTTSVPFVSTVIVPPGGGEVTLPPGTGPGAFRTIPPDEDGFTCGGGPQGYVPAAASPPLPNPYAGLTAKLSPPSVVTAGSSFAFTVTLTNTGVVNDVLIPCPSYVEAVMVNGHTLSPQSHQLNCDVIEGIPAHSSVTYAMRYDAPNDVAASAELLWSLVGWPPPAAEFVTAKAAVTLLAP